MRTFLQFAEQKHSGSAFADYINGGIMNTKTNAVLALLLGLGLVAGITGCSSVPEKDMGPTQAEASGKIIESYIRTWPIGSTVEEQQANNRHWTADDIKGDLLTQLIISFAHVNGTTAEISFPDVESEITPFPNLWEEVAAVQKKFPALKMVVSIGGWGADGFSQVSADDVLRAKFVANIVDLVRGKNLDGIDIDWEYPVGPDWGQAITSSPADAENFITLLGDIRSAFNALSAETGKTYSISCAVPASTWYPQKIDVAAVSEIVDVLKLMTYDYYGSWSATTGHHSNIFVNPADPAWGGWSTAQTVDMYLAAGVPAEKMVVGVAFYGCAWSGVAAGDTNGLFQSFASGAYPDGVSWPLAKQLLEGGEYTRYWDEVAQTAWLYNGDTFVSYTDAEEIAVIRNYVEEKGLAGFMIWEYGHDPDGELLELLSK